MSILSQAAVVVLILFIISILVKSNHELDQAAISGENFVDSWAIAQARKEEYQKNGFPVEDQDSWMQSLPGGAGYEDLEEDPEEEESGPDETFSSERREVEPETGFLLLDEENRPVGSVMIDHLPFTIGHSPDNDLVLDDLSVAKNHCRVDEIDGSYILEDLGTGTGLYVDGKRTDRTTLIPGMRISIGAGELIVEKIKCGK